MAKIYAPNKAYTGISATVPFVNGVGETDNADLLAWFKRSGYTVDGVDPSKADTPPNGNDDKDLKDMTVEELIVYAAEKDIDLGQATTHAGILKKLQEAEKQDTE